MPTPQQVANLKAAFIKYDIPWPKGRTLFWHSTGPLIRYNVGKLFISDINPDVNVQWRMSRMEMLKFGWRCIAAAILP